MKKSILIFILSVSLPYFLYSQNTAFKGGEVLRYTGSFYVSSLWSDLAELKMEVLDYEASNGKKMYKLKATARTYKSGDSYFKIRDFYQSWVSKQTIYPYMFKRNVDEGGYKFNIKYIFKRKSKKAKYTYERKGREKIALVPIDSKTHDLMSLMYYIRTVDYSKKQKNSSFSLSVIIDGKVQKIRIKYLGTEKIKVGKYGYKNCYKLGVSVSGNIVKTKASNNAWLTADANKVPVLIKANIPVGSIHVRLIEMKGLKN